MFKWYLLPESRNDLYIRMQSLCLRPWPLNSTGTVLYNRCLLAPYPNPIGSLWYAGFDLHVNHQWAYKFLDVLPRHTTRLNEAGTTEHRQGFNFHHTNRLLFSKHSPYGVTVLTICNARSNHWVASEPIIHTFQCPHRVFLSRLLSTKSKYLPNDIWSCHIRA